MPFTPDVIPLPPPTQISGLPGEAWTAPTLHWYSRLWLCVRASLYTSPRGSVATPHPRHTAGRKEPAMQQRGAELASQGHTLLQPSPQAPQDTVLISRAVPSPSHSS